MRIEDDIKLDFSDVLIRPKRSVLKSRVEVALERRRRSFAYADYAHGGRFQHRDLDTLFNQGVAIHQGRHPAGAAAADDHDFLRRRGHVHDGSLELKKTGREGPVLIAA